jgi:hypothetical protein
MNQEQPIQEGEPLDIEAAAKAVKQEHMAAIDKLDAVYRRVKEAIAQGKEPSAEDKAELRDAEDAVRAVQGKAAAWMESIDAIVNEPAKATRQKEAA